MNATSVLRSLSRLGHVWVENPVSLILFTSRILRSLPYTFEEIGSSAWTVLSRIASQTWKTVIRSSLPVLAVGLASGFGISALLSQAGDAVMQFTDLVVLPFLAAHVLPLITALVLISRSGATIAAKFALYPAVKGKKYHHFPRRELQQLMFPRFIANVIGGAVSYIIIAALVVGAGHGYAIQSRTFAHDTIDVVRANEVIAKALVTGVWSSALFGGIVAYIAAAYGVQAAERFVSEEEATHDLHYAVWESSVTSFLLCTGLAVAIGSALRP